MNKERMLAKIGYGAIVAFILAVTLVVSCTAKAQTQTQTKSSTEALPIVCTPQTTDLNAKISREFYWQF